MFRRFSEWVHDLPLRVATKFAIALMGGALFGLGAVVTGLALHEQRALALGTATDLQSQGDALAPLLNEVWMREGEGRALELLRAADALNGDVSLRIERDSPVAARVEQVGGNVSVRTTAIVPGHVLVLEKSQPRLATALFAALEAFLLAAIPLSLAALLAAYALGEWLVGAPLRRVAAHTLRIGGGDFSDQLVVRGSVEIAGLKAAINRMSDDLERERERAQLAEQRRVDAVERLRHADRLTTVGTLAAGIAHELGTPLNVIMLETRSIERASNVPSRIEDGIVVIRNQATRVTTIVRQLLSFARRQAPVRTVACPREVVTSAAGLVSALARSRACSVAVECTADELLFRVDSAGVEQLLTNLLVNAFDAMPAGGEVAVRIWRATRRGPGCDEASDFVCIEVEDEGHGMDDHVRARVFEPFFTTKDVGSGTGLGLSVAHGIAEDHGGFIEVRNAPRSGSVFAVYLPVDGAPDHGAPAERPRARTLEQPSATLTNAG